MTLIGPVEPSLLQPVVVLDPTCSPARAAELLGVNRKTVYRWLAAGCFPVPATKVGGVWLINAPALNRFLGL